MRERHAHRPIESPHARDARRSWRDPKVRRPAGIDPRLPGAGRRRGRWLSGPARLGSEIDGRGSRQVRRIWNPYPRTGASGTSTPPMRAPSQHTLSREREQALLFRTLATLRTDIPLFDDVDQLRWNGPTPGFTTLAARLDAAKTEGKRYSFRKRPQWIQPRGAPRRHIACNRAYDQQRQRDKNVHSGGRYAESGKARGEQRYRRPGERSADRDTNASQNQPAALHQPHNVAVSRADGDADAELLHAAAHRVGN